MFLAHGGETGPNFEAMVLAVPLVLVGVILFVQKTAKPIVSVVLVLMGVAIAVGGLTVFAGEDPGAHASADATGSAYTSMVTGLCQARETAAADPEEATRIFQDDVHVPLHDLAADVQETDRAAAAALLEAKEAVESQIEAEGLSEDGLDDLLAATIAALGTIDVEAPTC